jgi:hypothetical protein
MHSMEEEKVWITSLHLEGETAEWYYALERDYGILSWPRFSELSTCGSTHHYEPMV